MEYRSRSKTSVISGCGMLIRGVVKFSARNCPGINFRKVGNYGHGMATLPNEFRLAAIKHHVHTGLL